MYNDEDTNYEGGPTECPVRTEWLRRDRSILSNGRVIRGGAASREVRRRVASTIGSLMEKPSRVSNLGICKFLRNSNIGIFG